MTGVLHADMLEHTQQKGAELHYVLELDIAGETVRLGFGVASKSLGNFKPWLKSMGDITRRLSGRLGGLEAPTLSVEIDDTGGQFTLAYGKRLKGVDARCKALGPEKKANGQPFPAAAHHTYFVGVVGNRTKDGNVVTLELRFKDDKLVAPVPRPAISQYVYTSLPGETDLRGKAIPYLVGNHDSTGLDALGMVKCEYVGSPGAGRFQYEVCGGWWLTAVRIFSANVEMATPVDYEILQTLTGDSRKVTIVEFTSDQEEKEILADLQDLESTPTGPFARLQQALADLSYGDYHGDHLDPTLAPVDAASVTAVDTFLVGGLGLGHSYAVPQDRVSGNDMVAEHCLSFDVWAYWGYDGTLHFTIWELRYQGDQSFLGPGAVDVSLQDRQVLSSNVYLSEPSFSSDPESAIARVLGKSGRRASDGSWLNPRSVVHDLDADKPSREVELPCLPASAESVGNLEYMIAELGSVSGVIDFVEFGAASIEEVLVQGPPPANGNKNVYVNSSKAGDVGAGTAEFQVGLTDVPEIVAGQSLTVWITYWAFLASSGDEDELRVSLVIGGTPYPCTTIVGPGLSVKRTAVAVFPISPDTTLPWTRTELQTAELKVVWEPSTGAGALNGSKRVRIMQLYAAFAYTAAANVSPASLAILSRMAWRYRDAPEQMTVLAPLSYLDYDLGDDIPLEDLREGWGGQPWSRGRGRLVAKGEGPGLKGVQVTVEDVTKQLTTFWWLGRALAGVDGASAAGDGMAVILPGSQVTVTRASPKCLDAPAGIGVQSAGPVAQILDNCLPSERRGTLVERERYNELARSRFASGLTGLTQTPGSGTIDIDTTVGEQLYVDPALTDGHLILTAGAPHSSETRVTWPTTGVVGLGSDHMVASIDYKCSSITSGDGPSWRLVRGSDSFYWNDSTGLFQVGAVDNPLDPSLGWDRSESKPIDIIAGKSRVYDFSLSLPAGGTASRTVRIGDVQLESSHSSTHGDAKWRSSRIPTDATGGIVRAADQILIGNDKDDGILLAHTLPNERGGLRWHLRLNWSSANAATSTVFTVYTLRYDSNNAWVLAYVVGSGWLFQARSGGVNYAATVNVAVEAGVEYELDTRWTSDHLGGEWGKPWTLTLIVKRVGTGEVLGSAEITYVRPVATADASIGLGHDTSVAGRQIDGFIIEVRETPLPSSDEAMLAETFDLAEEDGA